MPQDNDSTTEQNSTENSDFTSITNSDPVLEKKLKILFLEVEVLRQSGYRVPDSVKLGQWKELLEMETRSRRRKYLSYLFGVEKKQENRKKKKDEAKQKREDAMNTAPENTHIRYGLGHNTILIRVYDNTINHFYHSRLIQAMQFSQKLVIDCSYDSHMTSREAQNCGKQLMLMFSDNRIHDNPFDLYLCNARRESNTIKQLVKCIPTIYDLDFPINITEKSYLDLFPKENIVYLTPHCREDLREFDHDAIYIIGAMVDKGNNEPLSLAKAKREGLKMAKLPLDRYLMWGSGGSKSLTLNQMMQILLDIRATGSWDKALQHVPRRKIITTPELQEQCSKKVERPKRQLRYTIKDTSKYC
ncbi:Mitochondrial ribonuclease P protein 1-like protein [Cryptotermes secundus]|uniref:RNA (guanine-9-)-methyltransferase domain-containing protein 1 n=2 Tax=Cryptotermes secundus TaxID=105785 RepID=A0A2J7QYF3_9NEOP|nr:Mitochondrial ribonuclease P protein 1-like protein [Cryptotermes secundus]